jgi:putative flippase GtrA
MTPSGPGPATATRPADQTRQSRRPVDTVTVAPTLDIVVPVFNEQRQLAASVHRLHEYLSTRFPFTFRITVVDNASTDDTHAIAREVATDLPHVRVVHLDRKGRGRALRAAWSASDASVLAYTDVDLSTDLNALLPLVAPLVSGHSDVAIGSRLARTARVRRGPKREVISRTYNLLLRTTLSTGFRDAQCGFKAIRADAARALLPLVRDETWFFDTELLVLSERAGLRIHEVPVDWTDDPDSRVDIVDTALGDLKGVARLTISLGLGRVPLERIGRDLGRRDTDHEQVRNPLLRFALIGVVSTVAYVALYALLRTGLSAQAANATALLLTAVANTTANRRLTFAIRGRTDALRHQIQGLALFVLALALSAGALAILHRVVAHPARIVELTVLLGSSAVAALMRYLLLRSWVFRDRPAAEPASSPALP